RPPSRRRWFPHMRPTFAIRLREGLEKALIAAALVAVLGLAATGCGDGSDKADAGSKIVAVELTDLGCPEALELPAGPTTFAVSNDGADAVSEIEILDGDTILGEVENITPGRSGVFSLTLKPGSYRTFCPGGSSTERGELSVAGGANARA